MLIYKFHCGLPKPFTAEKQAFTAENAENAEKKQREQSL
jgi:hypothetical protein